MTPDERPRRPGAARQDAARQDAARQGAARQGEPRQGEPGTDRRGARPSERRDEHGRERGAARSQGRQDRTAAAPSARRKGAGSARGVAYDVLRAVAESDSYANLVLPPMLHERRIDTRDAAFATELAYGTLRMRGRYDAIIEQCAARPTADIDGGVLDLLRMGVHQQLAMRVPPHAAVSETVGLTRERVGVGPSQFVNAVLRAVGRESLETWLERIADAADPAGTSPTDRLAVVESHPGWIVRALREALAGSGRDAAEIGALLRADNEPPHVTLVARPGLVTNDELAVAAPASHAGRWAPTARVLDGGDPAQLAAVRDGRAGVQDEGSQLVALAVAAAPLDGPDERWLDLCAGPGGKAALLAAIAGQRGARLVANEVLPHRTELVERALAAVPADAVEEVRTGDGRTIGTREPASYDRVMVDAPCTGLGALRRRPEARWRRTPADLVALGELQRALLTSALAAVRPGGVVAYVTCSPHLVETQLVVKDVLRAVRAGGTEVEVVDARAVMLSVAPGLKLPSRTDVQLWPHVHGTDAMHLTLLRRVG